MNKVNYSVCFPPMQHYGVKFPFSMFTFPPLKQALFRSSGKNEEKTFLLGPFCGANSRHRNTTCLTNQEARIISQRACPSDKQLTYLGLWYSVSRRGNLFKGFRVNNWHCFFLSMIILEIREYNKDDSTCPTLTDVALSMHQVVSGLCG